jgi:F420-dependent oxidoreductase-like protein
MKISTTIDYAGGFREAIAAVVDYERAGLDAVWVPEAYGFDSPSLMGYLAAVTNRVEIGSDILPTYTRTPTLIAMTAAGLDALSEGRFRLGLGASGPRVVEGFHGVRYTAPLARTRETIDICRTVWAREAPLVHEGQVFTLPLPPDAGTGLGKALRIITHPHRPRIPIWVASLGTQSVAMTAERAEGWLPAMFVPEKASGVWGDALRRGLAKRDAALGPLQISAGGLLAIGEGHEARAVRDKARAATALYVGGMGAKTKNFYNDVLRHYGYEREAVEIQDLYLDGRKDEAASLVPAEYLALSNLCGPASYVAERIAAFREAGVTDLQVTPVPLRDQRAVDLIEQVKSLAG